MNKAALLKKIRTLAERGVGGEAENAEKLLAHMMEKYDISEDELDADTAICGTSLSSYSGTFLAVIPAELRAVLKSVTKYTNNTGNSTAASAVTATTDYFFLLSEYEVFGSTKYANSSEASKQAQYAYYSAGNSKIKHKHNATSTAALWWLRSPRASSSGRFVRVYTGGTVDYYYASCSVGFAPGFCV